MDVAELLVESHGRVGEVLHRAVGGLDVGPADLAGGREANTIAWLAWHAARGEDAQVADVAGTEQVWTAQDWAPGSRCRSTTTRRATGRAAPRSARCRRALSSCSATTTRWPPRRAAYLAGLTEVDLDRVVDRSWDPPVTFGVRLVSVIGDSLQHAGQASFVRGLLQRAT